MALSGRHSVSRGWALLAGQLVGSAALPCYALWLPCPGPNFEADTLPSSTALPRNPNLLAAPRPAHSSHLPTPHRLPFVGVGDLADSGNKLVDAQVAAEQAKNDFAECQQDLKALQTDCNDCTKTIGTGR